MRTLMHARFIPDADPDAYPDAFSDAYPDSVITFRTSEPPWRFEPFHHLACWQKPCRQI